MKKMEFSKKIWIFLTIFISILTIFTMVIIVVTKDTSPLSYLITAWFGVFGTATAFYYNKAKLENLKKMGIKFDLEKELNDESRFWNN